MWTIGATARSLGVAVTTLRSWDCRYELVPTGHVPGAHRRYTDDDVRRLRRMLDLTQDGMSPAAAARLVLDDTTATEPARDGGGTGAVPVGRSQPAARGLARGDQARRRRAAPDRLPALRRTRRGRGMG